MTQARDLGVRTILHLSSSSGPGGAETVVASVASGLNPSRYRSLVCLFRDGWLRHHCEQLGLETHIIPINGMLDFAWLQQFHRLLRERRVSLIHAHEFGANTYGTLAGRLARVPVVATVHGRGYYADRGHRRLAYRAVSRAAAMVVVSEEVKRFVVERTGASARRVRVVYNGIRTAGSVPQEIQASLRADLGISDEERVVAAVGSLYLLDAAPSVLGACPPTVFLVAGRGEREAALRAQARSLGIDARVRFLGFRQDIPALLAMCDVFVQPSLSEGLSIAILEAMAAARPVVATRVGGNPELVVDGETGLLVEAADAKGLASAMIRILRDPAEARRFGNNGLSRGSTRFTAAAMVREYEAIYDTALRLPPRSVVVDRVAG
ncbi:MAG: glycosyltransferase [Chloroflexi bacterium]|nr:MAG: glycosyltransferase [Chloroflexota bacterium]